ncbi:MAG: FtsX-like permease family protein [Chloroflexi bacterium]|nr:FtsX-like permease family protein [Chloroflexota bacterium]
MIRLAVRQLARERHVAIILLAAITIVTGFAAFAPLYMRMLRSAELDARLDSLTDRQQRLEVTRDSPPETDLLEPIRAQIGSYIVSEHRFAYAPARTCSLALSGESSAWLMPCYRQYAYPDIERDFTVLDGRLPEPREDVIEFALTQAALDAAVTLDPNLRPVVGSRFATSDGLQLKSLELVGILAPVEAQASPRWDAQESIFGSIIKSFDNAPDELDWGIIVHPDTLAGALNRTSPRAYVSRAVLRLDHIEGRDLDAIERQLDAGLDALRTTDPTLEINSPLSTLIDAVRARMGSIAGPVLLLVGMVLALLLYTLVITGSLALERARGAWAQMGGRGASARQLVVAHAVSMGLLSVAAWLVGQAVAFVLAGLLTAVGPQASVIAAPSAADLPAESWLWGGAAAVTSVVVLTLPAVPLALTDFARLRQSAGRTFGRPVWARFYVDIAALALGIAFTARAGAIDALNDPFSMAGPVLVIVGGALLWLRVFPVVTRVLGAVTAGLQSVSVRLALWGVERSPATFGQLVLLVVGTLSLGIASLVIAQTRSDTAWEAAQAALGADAVLTVAPTAFDPAFDYEAIDGISRAAPRVELNSGGTPDRPQLIVIGYGRADEPPIQALEAIERPVAGVELPADAVSVAVDVFSPADDAVTTAAVTALIMNADSIVARVPLDAPDETLTDRWQTYAAPLEPGRLGRTPWRLIGIELPSAREEPVEGSRVTSFDHAVLLGEIRAVGADDGEIALVSDGAAPPEVWSRPEAAGRFTDTVLSFERSDIAAPAGGSALRVLYSRSIGFSSSTPTLLLFAVDQPLPVVVTTAFADDVGGRSALRRPLAPGDTGSVQLDDPSSPIGRLRMSYVVEAVIPAPPPYRSDQAMVFTRADWLQSAINPTRASLQVGVAVNRVVFDFTEREPAGIRDALMRSPGALGITTAGELFAAQQRDPLANAITGLLFGGFWAGLALLIVQSGYFAAVSLRRRAESLGVLRSLGWQQRQITRMLAAEYAAVVVPALVVGTAFGLGSAVFLLSLLGSDPARMVVPIAGIGVLIGLVATLFVVLVGWSSAVVRRIELVDVLRANG